MNSKYDYDVVVIGGGPAGLAAATRVRWVKGYHALAGSVCIVEAGEPGGLLSWGSCVLTGPGWAYSGKELSDVLMSDVSRMNIPIVHNLVTAITKEHNVFVCRLRNGKELRCLSVIIAAGFRPLANETSYYLKGVRITFKGYEHFPSLARTCARDANGEGLVVVGNEKTKYLSDILKNETKEAGTLTLVTEGRLIHVHGDEKVSGVTIERQDGSQKTIPCGAVLMDYNAMELMPDFTIESENLERDERGFICVDASMKTSIHGIFAAGDVTGRYAATLMALGDGVCAGLGAYEHSFKMKFGKPPVLFAYAATDKQLPKHPIDLPHLPDDAVPVALGEAPDWVTGQHTLKELADQQELTTDQLRTALMPNITDKTITVHRMCGASD